MFTLKSFLFAACFLFSCSVSQDYSVTPISTSSGLYFEEIGEVVLSNGNWEFVTSIDYESYLLFYQYLLERARDIEEICEMLHSNTCKERYAGIQSNLDRIVEVDKTMAHFLGVTTETRRLKRFWTRIGVNIGANLDEQTAKEAVSKIFGEGSNVDLSSYNLSISKLQSSQQQQQNEFQLERTSFIIQGENLKILDENVEKIKSTIKNIDNSIRRIKNNVANKTKEISIFEVVIHRLQVNEIATNFVLLMNQFQPKQQNLFEVMKNANMGRIDPYILPSLTLVKMLIGIQEHLPEGIEFLYYPHIKNAIKLYNVIKPSVYLFNYKIIFILQIPLVYSKTFNLHKITSLPIAAQDNKFVFILPQEPFIIVDNNYQDYMLISKDNFVSQCSDLERTKYLCREAQEIFNSQLSKECEVNLLKSPKMVPETCNKTVMALDNSMFIKLQRDRSWIYVVPTVEDIIVSCGKNRTHNVSLKGTGFIRVNENCLVIKQNGKSLQPFITCTNLMESDFSPCLNLTDFINQFNDVKVKDGEIIENISPFEFNKLEEVSHKTGDQFDDVNVKGGKIEENISAFEFKKLEDVNHRIDDQFDDVKVKGGKIVENISAYEFSKLKEVSHRTGDQFDDVKVKDGQILKNISLSELEEVSYITGDNKMNLVPLFCTLFVFIVLISAITYLVYKKKITGEKFRNVCSLVRTRRRSTTTQFTENIKMSIKENNYINMNNFQNISFHGPNDDDDEPEYATIEYTGKKEQNVPSVASKKIKSNNVLLNSLPPKMNKEHIYLNELQKLMPK